MLNARRALVLGLSAAIAACRINASGLAPEEITLGDSAVVAEDAAATSMPDAVTDGGTDALADALTDDVAPVFPVDDSSAIPECTGMVDGTACGASSPRSICVAGECLPSRCGDSIVDLGNGEDCDDGNINDGDTCPSDCRAKCKIATDCNDSNPCSVDACDTAKRVCAPPTPAAKGTTCPLVAGGTGVCNGTSCTAATCGNKAVEPGEDCDDGNTDDRDGCRSDCRWTCTTNANCDDLNACNGVETCDTAKHTCRVPMAKSCNDMNACTDDRCVAPGGACMNTLRDLDGDGSPCGEDCHDQNPRVNPGVTDWFAMPYTTPMGTPSFDYNCSGANEKRFTVVGACTRSGGSCNFTFGWSGAVPNCGASAPAVIGCEPGSCKPIVSDLTFQQQCH